MNIDEQICMKVAKFLIGGQKCEKLDKC